MRRVLILGSCVSRDMFELLDKSEFEIVGYYARSSLASLASPPWVQKAVLERISSPFRRRMVEQDMDKSFWQALAEAKFDTLLVDFIDERFSLCIGTDGRVVTLSNEYRESRIEPQGRVTASESEEFTARWRAGWELLAKAVHSLDLVEKLRLSKVFWAPVEAHGPTAFRQAQIERTNIALAGMYRHAAETLRGLRFIDYPAEDMEADPGHKWGIAPFHFRTGFYLQTARVVFGEQVKLRDI